MAGLSCCINIAASHLSWVDSWAHHFLPGILSCPVTHLRWLDYGIFKSFWWINQIGIINTYWKLFSSSYWKGIDTTKLKWTRLWLKLRKQSAQPRRLQSLRIPSRKDNRDRSSPNSKYRKPRNNQDVLSVPPRWQCKCLRVRVYSLTLGPRERWSSQRCCFRTFLDQSFPRSPPKAKLLCPQQLKKPFSNLKDSKMFSQNNCYCIPALPQV